MFSYDAILKLADKNQKNKSHTLSIVKEDLKIKQQQQQKQPLQQIKQKSTSASSLPKKSESAITGKSTASSATSSSRALSQLTDEQIQKLRARNGLAATTSTSTLPNPQQSTEKTVRGIKPTQGTTKPAAAVKPIVNSKQIDKKSNPIGNGNKNSSTNKSQQTSSQHTAGAEAQKKNKPQAHQAQLAKKPVQPLSYNDILRLADSNLNKPNSSKAEAALSNGITTSSITAKSGVMPPKTVTTTTTTVKTIDKTTLKKSTSLQSVKSASFAHSNAEASTKASSNNSSQKKVTLKPSSVQPQQKSKEPVKISNSVQALKPAIHSGISNVRTANPNAAAVSNGSGRALSAWERTVADLKRKPSKRRTDEVRNGSVGAGGNGNDYYDDEEEEDEYDSEMEDFIDDDTDVEEESSGKRKRHSEGVPSYSKMIRNMFGYDPTKYADESDDDLANMETNFHSLQKEESRSLRHGMLEDREEELREREMERKRKERIEQKKAAQSTSKK
jgi:protein SPT2